MNAKNAQIHQLFVRQEFESCLQLIDAHLRDYNNVAEYPLYVKALIQRYRNVQDSLTLFQAATALNPANVENLKQVARSLYLLGRHKQAVEIYDEALRLRPEDWELLHQKGLCFVHLGAYDAAVDCFLNANGVQRHDSTYAQLAKVFIFQGRTVEAIRTYQEALEFSPENCDFLTSLGLLYLQQGDNSRAFDYLGNSLTFDPRSAKTILAAGSIIQDHNDMDVALVKYRVAAVATPNSAHLWNNIGMCFFGKQRYVAAIACLKKALYLDPFEWIISYNLGLVHLATGQTASAFHFLSSSIQLKPDYAPTYVHLAAALAQLEDADNAFMAYDKAIELDAQDPLTRLNYAITLCNAGVRDGALKQYDEYKRLYAAMDAEARDSDPDMQAAARTLAAELNA